MNFNFTPPVQCWGPGPFPGPSAVVLQCILKHHEAPVSDDLWHILVDLVSARAEEAGVSEMYLLADSDGRAKKVRVNESVVIDPVSLNNWWQTSPQGVSARVPDQEWDLSLYAIGAPSSVLVIEVFAHDPDQAEIERYILALEGLANLADGLTGHVGIGKGWKATGAFATKGSVRGYGPAIVANSDDLDVPLLDNLKIEVNELDGDRYYLRIPLGDDLVEGTKEIRRACWPGMGLRVASRGVDDGTINFEGRPGYFSWGDRVLRHIAKLSRSNNTAGDSSSRLTTPIVQSISTADGESIDTTTLENLNSLVQAWRRIATSTLAAPNEWRDDLIEFDVDAHGSEITITCEPVPQIAIDALKLILDTEWKPLFRQRELDVSSWQ